MDSAGLVSGTLKWGKVSGKLSGAVVNGSGVGTVNVKIGGVTLRYEFTAVPPDLDLPPIVTVR